MLSTNLLAIDWALKRKWRLPSKRLPKLPNEVQYKQVHNETVEQNVTSNTLDRFEFAERNLAALYLL